MKQDNKAGKEEKVSYTGGEASRGKELLHTEEFEKEEETLHTERTGEGEEKRSHVKEAEKEEEAARTENLVREEKRLHRGEAEKEAEVARTENPGREEKRSHVKEAEKEEGAARTENPGKEGKLSHREEIKKEEKVAHTENPSREEKRLHRGEAEKKEGAARTENLGREEKRLHVKEAEKEEEVAHTENPSREEKRLHVKEAEKEEGFVATENPGREGKLLHAKEMENKGIFQKMKKLVQDGTNQDIDASQSDERKDKASVKWFHINEKYMAICRYALFVIFASILLYMLVSNWGRSMEVLANFVGVLTPFLIGILITYFLTPLVAKVEGILTRYITKGKYKKVTLVVAMMISYIAVLGFIVVAFVFVVPQIAESLRELTEKVPVMYNHVAKLLTDLQKANPEINLNEINKQLAGMVPDLVEHGTNLVGDVLPMVYSVSVSIVRLAINIVLGIVVSLYLIYSKDKFRHQAKRLVYAFFSEERGDVFCTTFRECNDIFSAFLISKAIDSLIIGCICCVAMNILGLPYAVLLSVIVGITNMIPYFGPFIGAIPGVLIYLCIDLESAIIFAIMILVLQQFDGLILGPRLLGQSTGLSPIWVIFAITVGGAYFGVLGMFIGVPIVAVVAFLLDKLIKSRLKGREIRGLQEFENSED